MGGIDLNGMTLPCSHWGGAGNPSPRVVFVTMETPARILMLDDSADDLELIEQELRRGGIVFTAQRVHTKEAFLQALSDFSPDLILSDHVIPRFDGLGALAIARQKCPEARFILVSGQMGE